VMDVLSDLQPCDAAHLSECYARHFASALDFGDGSTAEMRRLAEAFDRCQVDIFDACSFVLKQAEKSDEPQVAEATRRLQLACDQGDADACAHAPGRAPIAPAALCAASDYEACAAIHCKDHCGHPKSANEVQVETRTFESTIAAMTTFRDRMCACKNLACVNGVSEDMNKWGEQRGEQVPLDLTLTEDHRKAIEIVTGRMAECAFDAIKANKP
jgi:hypothetical protein